jgi:cysteine synthase
MNSPSTAEVKPKRYIDINAVLQEPRIVPVDLDVLPLQWERFCVKNKIKPYLIVLYDNPAETGKLWPTSLIALNGVNRNDHHGSDTACDSTSGGYGLAWAALIKMYQKRDPSFPIKRFVAVVPRTLPLGKRRKLLEEGVEIIDADDATTAMKIAEEISKERGYWYTRQYWNPDNSEGYIRVAHIIADRLPDLGMVAWGVGSGGGCSGVMPVFSERFKNRSFGFRRIAVVVEDGQRVGGVRDEYGLESGSLGWRAPNIDGVRFIGEDAAYKFSAAIWRHQNRHPENACLGGPSTGFAAEGAMLALRELVIMRRENEIRAPDGYIHVASPSLDRRDPYREEYAQKAIYWS